MSTNDDLTEPPEPIAQPGDLRIETDLDESHITREIEDAAYDNARVNDIDEMSDYLRGRIEALYASIRIRERLDRAIESGQSESSRVTFEGQSLESMRSELNELDPSGELVGGGLIRTSRTMTSTDQDELRGLQGGHQSVETRLRRR